MIPDLNETYTGDPTALRLREALISAGIISPLESVGSAVYAIEHIIPDIRQRVAEMLGEKADSMHACGLEFFEVQRCTDSRCDAARVMQSAADLVRAGTT